MSATITDAPSAATPRKGVFALALVLAVIGLAGSAYLAVLDVRVLQAGGAAISSFCTISEGFDCVTVAASKYALFLGVPVAFYGVEFFLAMLGLLLLSRLSWWPLKQWQSYLAWFAALSVPVIVILGYLSFVVIGSLCLVCLTVHGANLVLLLTLLAVHRRGLAELAFAGPAELLGVLRSRRAAQFAVATAAVAALSQFVWVPYVLPAGAHGAGAARYLWKGAPSAGLTLGSAAAPLRVEVFTDYQCPFCDKANEALLSVAAKHPQAIFIRHHDFPLDQACNPTLDRPFHRNACDAARYARCAAAQDRFWAMDELLFLNRETLAETDLRRLAGEAGLDLAKLDQCLADPSTMEAIQADIREGAKRGVKGTPAFFINGKMVSGYKPAEFWEQKLKDLGLAQ